VGLRVHDTVVARRVSDILALHNRTVDQSLSQLSTGRRINDARDDASGLAIAEKFRSQVAGLNQAVGNSQDGIFVLSAAEGSMNEVHAVLQRMRDIAVQAANDVLTGSDRAHIQVAMRTMSEEIDRIGASSEYNTRKLLDGSMAGGMTLQVGPNAGQVLNISLDTLSAASLGVLTTQLSVDNAFNSSATIARLDAAIGTMSRWRGTTGATINRLEHAIADLGVMATSMSGSESRIRDLDMARAATTLATSQLLSQSGSAMLAQANAQPQSVLALLR